MAPPTPTSITLVDGRYFDPYNPDPSAITLDVLEHGLRQLRFNGQTARPITIAEHSMRVRRIVAEVMKGESKWRRRDAELWALLHDGHEALVPWGDCLRPGKTDAMREVEKNVDEAIVAAVRSWGIGDFAVSTEVGVKPEPWPFETWPTENDRLAVKAADDIALYLEAMLWQPNARDWVEFPGGYHRHTLARLLPVVEPRPGECWSAEVHALLAGEPWPVPRRRK